MPCLAAKRRVEAVPPGVPSKPEVGRAALCTRARLRRRLQPGVETGARTSAAPSHLPWKGRLWDRACQGFPYEGTAFFCYIHSGRISMPCLAAKRRVEAVPPRVPSKTEMRREALCTMARLRRSMQPGV